MIHIFWILPLYVLLRRIPYFAAYRYPEVKEFMKDSGKSVNGDLLFTSHLVQCVLMIEVETYVGLTLSAVIGTIASAAFHQYLLMIFLFALSLAAYNHSWKCYHAYKKYCHIVSSLCLDEDEEDE